MTARRLNIFFFFPLRSDLKEIPLKVMHACVLSHNDMTLFDPLDCSLPGSSVHGSLQARILFRQEYWSGLPCPPPENLLHRGIKPMSLTSPALAGKFFTTSTTWEAHLQRSPTHKCYHKILKLSESVSKKFPARKNPFAAETGCGWKRKFCLSQKW